MIKQTLKKHLINFRGTPIDSKIVIFESDDWGSIRIPSLDVRQQLLSKDLIKANDPFSKYDALETATDYRALYEILKKHKDSVGNHPILTANMIMNNPDFEKIAASKFEIYYNESFVNTYQSYSGSSDAFSALKEGIEQRLIYPQFHGNEHLNVSRWMRFLKEGNERYHFAFNNKCFSIDEINSTNRRGNLMAAYDYDNEDEFKYIQTSVASGLKEFEEIFGYKSKTTIAPCYVWDQKVENIFQQYNIEGMQGSSVQNVPVEGKSFKKKYRYSGQRNADGQQYYVRNGLFEPSIAPNIKWVEKCLESIAISFQWKRPAIIGTHRINYCSRLDHVRTNQNLADLDELLSQMLKRWPEIKFIDTSKLHTLYCK